MAIDDQSASRAAAVLRNALGTLDRFRGRPAVLWEDFSLEQRNDEEARLQAAIDAGVYTPQEIDAEALALENAVVGVVLGADVGGSLVFDVQPAAADEDVVIDPPIEVSLRNGLGEIVTGFTGEITITKAPATGVLGGTLTQAAVAGVATFDDLEIDTADDYTLTATFGSVSVESDEFTISAP